MLHLLFSYALLGLVCGYALWRGGWPERATALTIILCVGMTAVAHAMISNVYAKPALVTLVIDLLGLLALVGITLKADRFWPIPLTAFHLISVTGHVLRLIEADIQPLIYKILIAWSIYPMLAILDWGTYRHAQRRGASAQRSYQSYFPNMASLKRRLWRSN